MEMTDDIDCSEESEMELITLINDNAPDIRFSGGAYRKRHEQLGQFQQLTTAEASVAGWNWIFTGRPAASSVCQSIGGTRWDGEKDRYKAAVC